MIILHIVEKKEWQEQKNKPEYHNPSLDALGFLHCAQIPDLVDVANCYYRGNAGMLLLCIDTEKVSAEIKWEISEYGVAFPHICGELNQDAIVEVIDFPIDANGNFIFPEPLNKYLK